VILWRISNHVSLAGEGGLRASGRWHTRGHRVVYCSESPAAAPLEILVHFEMDVRSLPARYRLLKLQVPDELIAEAVSASSLPTDFRVTHTGGDNSACAIDELSLMDKLALSW